MRILLFTLVALVAGLAGCSSCQGWQPSMPSFDVDTPAVVRAMLPPTLALAGDELHAAAEAAEQRQVCLVAEAGAHIAYHAADFMRQPTEALPSISVERMCEHLLEEPVELSPRFTDRIKRLPDFVEGYCRLIPAGAAACADRARCAALQTWVAGAVDNALLLAERGDVTAYYTSGVTVDFSACEAAE